MSHFSPDVSWPGFLYCLKYLGFGFVVCADRTVYDIRVPYKRFLISKRSQGTLMSNTDRSEPRCF